MVTMDGCDAIFKFPNSEHLSSWAELWEAYERHDYSEVWWKGVFEEHFVDTFISPGGGLYFAANFGFCAVVEKFILEYGCDLDEYGGFNDYPMIAAAAEGHRDIVKLLLDAGADTNVGSRFGDTLLHYAIGCKWWDLAEELVGDSVNVEGGLFGYPLNAVIKEWDYVEDAKLIIGLKQSEGSPLTVDDHGILRLLLLIIDSGADLNTRNSSEQTALHIAAGSNYCGLLKLLLENGANAELKDRKNYSPIQEALHFGSMEAVYILNVWHNRENVDNVFRQLSGTVLEHNQAAAWNVRKTDIRELAHNLPEDHATLDILARSYLQDYHDPEMRNMALSLFDRSVEVYSRNASAVDMSDIEHPEECMWSCLSIFMKPHQIRGLRFYYFNTQDTFSTQLGFYYCSDCRETWHSDPNIICIQIPSQQWIERHIPQSG